MAQIIIHREKLFDETVEGVIWYYTEAASIIPELAEEHGVEFREGVPNLDDFPPSEGLKIVVLDDLMNCNKDDALTRFYIKGAHHRNLCVFGLFQNLYNKQLREISLNSSVVIILKQKRDLSQIRSFCIQVEPRRWRSLLAAYNDATGRPGHQYLLFDFHIKTPEFLKYRTDILPGQKQIVYVLKK